MSWSYNGSMALILDTSRQLRSIDELTELVRAIASAPPSESETDWLEWKSQADLSEQRWHVQIAKYIAGFANRDPIVAKRSAGGCSYLVVGAEPGHVVGVKPIDSANLHSGISRYVRNTVRWNPQYIEHEGKQVLIFTVEPPEPGDPIVAMLRDFQSNERGTSSCRKGDVFVRRHGKTELAEQEDYDMLALRFAASAELASEMSVELLEAAAVPVACGSDVIANWCQTKRRSLLEPLEGAVEDVIPSRTGPLFIFNAEDRTADAYKSQVDSYLREMTPLLHLVARADAIRERAPRMQLVVVNQTEHNYAGVRVEVSIDGDVWGYQTAEEAQPEVPSPPRKWGVGPGFHLPIYSATPRIPKQDFWGPHIDNSGSINIEFPDFDLRPGGRVNLDPIYLVCDAGLAGKPLTAKWRATSSSASGIAGGEFPVKVLSEIFSLPAN